MRRWIRKLRFRLELFVTPTEWSMDDPALEAKDAPYEATAARRMHKNGWPAGELRKALNLRGSTLIDLLQKLAKEEHDVARSWRKIHHVEFPKGFQYKEK